VNRFLLTAAVIGSVARAQTAQTMTVDQAVTEAVPTPSPSAPNSRSWASFTG